MRCPKCGGSKSSVIDSRQAEDGNTIRRRRECEDCQHRFTTYERVEMPPLSVMNRSGNRESFDRDKLHTAVNRSVGKFFHSELEIEDVVNKVVEKVYSLGRDVVYSKEIGQAILDVLAKTNEVAYVRFASVFLQFKTLDEFERIIREQREKKEE